MTHSGIEPETSINQSPYAFQTELFRLMRVTRFNSYLYMVTVFSAIRGRVMYIIISIKQFSVAEIGKIYVHVYFHAPIQIIYNKVQYMYEATTYRSS